MNYRISPRKTKSGETRHVVSMEVWVDGERKNISGGTHASEAEAIRAGERLLMRYEDDDEKLKTVRGNRTLADWAQDWLAGLNSKQQTRNAYSHRMRLYIIPSLGHVRLKDLSPVMIENLINGAKLSRLAKSTKKGALIALDMCLQKAVRQGMIPKNPAESVELDQTKAQKKAEKSRKKVKTWTYEEVGKLLDASVGTPIEPVIILGLLAGLRPGEATVTRWSDINWIDGTVWVSRTKSRNESGTYYIEDSTKGGSDRHARLTSDSVFRLMALKERQESRDKLDPDAPIYGSETTSHSTTWKQVRSLCRKAGIKVLPPHSLRHTHASLLLENGASLAKVAKQLGHASPAVTSMVYWHLIDDEEDTLSGVMDIALGKVDEANPTEAKVNLPTKTHASHH